MAACGVCAACDGFGFARNTTATFDVFYWLQVTNYGVLYVLFDSPPSGSNHIDVWDLCLHVQMASPNYFVATVLATSPRREQAEKLFDSVHAPRVAAELGHTSPAMLYNTYREVVLPEEAERYWRIEPTPDAANVVAFAGRPSLAHRWFTPPGPLLSSSADRPPTAHQR